MIDASPKIWDENHITMQALTFAWNENGYQNIIA